MWTIIDFRGFSASAINIGTSIFARWTVKIFTFAIAILIATLLNSEPFEDLIILILQSLQNKNFKTLLVVVFDQTVVLLAYR